MSNNQKKVFVDLVKAELNKEIAEIENIPIGNYAPICAVSKVAWETHASTGALVWPKKLREMADQLFPEASQPQNRLKGEIAASNVGEKDFDEIISLIQKVNKLRQAENKKREQKRKEKLATNPNLFFYWCKSSSGEPGAKLNRRFEGRKDGKEFYLYIPVSHSDLANIPFAGQQSNDNKVNHFYLIDGFEMPTKTHYHNYTNTYFYEKSIELTDPISIIPCQGDLEEVNKTNHEKPIDSTENGYKEIYPPNSILNIFEKETNKYLNSNKSLKDLHTSFLINLFQNLNIKSIELTNFNDIFSDLIIIYNDGRKEICKYDAPDGDESNLIRRALKTVNEKDLDQQKLKKLQANSNSYKTISPTNSPKSSYVPYLLIGGAIVIAVLGAVWVSYRLGQKKNK